MPKRTPEAPRSGSVTIKVIADHLGISHSTVSRALNDHAFTKSETKHKVRQAAEKLGYVPYSAARALRADKTSLVGLILPEVENQVFATAAHTLAQRCLKAGLQLVLSISEDDEESEFKHVMALREARAIGIILTPSTRVLEKTINLLRNVPVVQYARRHAGLNAPSVSVAGKEGLFVGTSHLLQLGHRRIAYIGAAREMSPGAERLAGYIEAHARFNVPVDPALAYLGQTHQDLGHAAVIQLLELHDPPSAFILGSNAPMPGALRAFRQAGLEVPRDMSLVGYGDPSWYALWGGGITTMGIPLRELAEAATSQLMRQLRPEGEAFPKLPAHIALEPVFLLRGTTAKWTKPRSKIKSPKH